MALTEFPYARTRVGTRESRTRYGRPRLIWEHQRLVQDLQDQPGEWAVYSLHCTVNAAGSARRHITHNPPRGLAKHMDRLQWRSCRDRSLGAVLMVRWR